MIYEAAQGQDTGANGSHGSGNNGQRNGRLLPAEEEDEEDDDYLLLTIELVW